MNPYRMAVLLQRRVRRIRRDREDEAQGAAQAKQDRGGSSLYAYMMGGGA
jgi:hypothetical protein